MLQIDERLSDDELRYIKVTQVWFNLLVQLFFDHSNVTDWKIGGWTVDIINLFISTLSYHETVTVVNIENDTQGIKELDEEIILKKIKTIKTLIRWQPDIGIGAGNDRIKKYVAVVDANPEWGANHAYLDRWDVEYINAPKLTFIAQFNETSLREFEQLFVKFLAVNNEEELASFGAYLAQQYPNQ